MNKRITKEVLDKHFHCFFFSLKAFSEKYISLIFKKDAVIPKHVIYFCPLCMDNSILLLESGLYYSHEFSLDHFPPKSVGGTLEILTCKKCNNEAGSQYEALLKTKVQHEAYKRKHPSATINTKTKITGVKGSYSSFLKIDEKAQNIFDFHKYSPKSARYLIEWLNQSNKSTDWEYTVTISKPDEYKVLKALLKTAYLICFINWGYEFCFSYTGETIRNVFNDKEEYPLKSLAFWFDKDSDIEKVPLGICFIKKPTELNSFMVNIPLINDSYSSIASILIPGPTKEDYEKLKNMQMYLNNHPKVDVELSKITMSMPNNFYGYSVDWKNYINFH